MKFNKITTACLLTMAMTVSLGSSGATGSNEVIPVTTPTRANVDPEMQRMMNRLEQIEAMDLENMPRSERRKYAKEVKHIQKKMNAIGGGVYISAGALILIIVLLILLF